MTEKRSKPKSGGVETVGSYHPKTKEALFQKERILYWISKGAKISATTHNLLVSKGIITGKKVNVVKTAVPAVEKPPAEPKEPVVEGEKKLAESATESVKLTPLEVLGRKIS